MIRQVLMLGVVIVIAASSGASELYIPADGSVVMTDSLDDGRWYVIEARGEYGYYSADPAKLADAEWAYTYIDEVWGWFETPRGGDLDLYVDGVDISMMGKVGGDIFSRHVYSDEHIYRANVLGGGDAIGLSIYDENYTDNTGGLNVTIYPGWQEEIVAGQPGDTNADYIVDGRDYGDFVAQFGGPPGARSADFTGDGIVDLHDFVIQRRDFGLRGSPAGAGDIGAIAPEPATLIMLIGSLPVLLTPKRKSS
jgi:hypothetical protein